MSFAESVLYWPRIAHIGLIGCDSKAKQVYVKKWPELDLNSIDYESNLKTGLYKDGIAVRLGPCLSNGSKQLYSFALDFDGWDAVVAWFSSWEKVLEVSNKTRIEWHEDKCRIHMFFLSERPIANKKIPIKNSLLEVRCEDNLLFVHPSIHQEGKAYTPVGTPEIAILNNIALLKLEARIESLCRDYMSDEDKDAFEKWLDDPNAILGEGQGRHDALKFKINSYYFKYKDEWLDLTDEQRFQRAWDWNIAHCKPAKPKQEFDSLVEWTIETHKQTRDQLHKQAKELRKSQLGIKPTQAELIIKISNKICKEFFHDQYQTPYTAAITGDHIEALPISSKRFKNFLCGGYYEAYNAVPNAESVTSGINILKYKADFKGAVRPLQLRIARDNDSNDSNDILYDLTNKDWDIVRISEKGWDIEKSPIIFRRYSNQQPQVFPSREYDKDIFDKFMNLLNVKDNDNKLLLKCYIIALFVPGIQKAILMLHGDQGSAKTTLQELIKILVDPSSILTLAFPRDTNEFIQKLAHNYIACFDNVSVIPDWISDILCRAVTGSGFSKRMLFTDDDDIIYNFIRCVGFNGINLAATKADLLDRGLIIQLIKIRKDTRRENKALWAEFEKIRPQLLGYIFDILVKVLATISSVTLTELARMADFAKACEAISRCMGNKPDTFIKAYDRNIQLQTEQVLESNMIAPVIVKIMEDRNEWIGSATQLLSDMETLAGIMRVNTKSRAWPKGPNILIRRLNEVKATFEEVGIFVTRGLDAKTKLRTVEIRKTPLPSLLSYTDQNRAQITSDFGNDTLHDSIVSLSNHEGNNGSNDRNDILHNSKVSTNGKTYSCRNCSNITFNEADHWKHTVNKHAGKTGYPIIGEENSNGDRHPPEPSLSNNLNADFYSGYWHCKTCNYKDDGPGIKDHICKGAKN